MLVKRAEVRKIDFCKLKRNTSYFPRVTLSFVRTFTSDVPQKNLSLSSLSLFLSPEIYLDLSHRKAFDPTYSDPQPSPQPWLRQASPAENPLLPTPHRHHPIALQFRIRPALYTENPIRTSLSGNGPGSWSYSSLWVCLHSLSPPSCS